MATTNTQPMLTSHFQTVKSGGKVVGHIRYRETADRSYGFWQHRTLGSDVWAGEDETLLEAQLSAGGDVR